MKTIKEWFKSIKDEDVSQRALDNIMINAQTDSLANAIALSFNWDESYEGFDYWKSQYEKAKNNEL